MTKTGLAETIKRSLDDVCTNNFLGASVWGTSGCHCYIGCLFSQHIMHRSMVSKTMDKLDAGFPDSLAPFKLRLHTACLASEFFNAGDTV